MIILSSHGISSHFFNIQSRFFRAAAVFGTGFYTPTHSVSRRRRQSTCVDRCFHALFIHPLAGTGGRKRSAPKMLRPASQLTQDPSKGQKRTISEHRANSGRRYCLPKALIESLSQLLKLSKKCQSDIFKTPISRKSKPPNLLKLSGF